MMSMLSVCLEVEFEFEPQACRRRQTRTARAEKTLARPGLAMLPPRPQFRAIKHIPPSSKVQLGGNKLTKQTETIELSRPTIRAIYLKAVR